MVNKEQLLNAIMNKIRNSNYIVLIKSILINFIIIINNNIFFRMNIGNNNLIYLL
jgi:hypothetical protein